MDKYDVLHLVLVIVFIGLCVQYGLGFWQIVSLIVLVVMMVLLVAYEAVKANIDEDKIEAVLKRFDKL